MDRFCGHLEQVTHDFAKYKTKILLTDFNAKLWTEDTFKQFKII